MNELIPIKEVINCPQTLNIIGLNHSVIGVFKPEEIDFEVNPELNKNGHPVFEPSSRTVIFKNEEQKKKTLH